MTLLLFASVLSFSELSKEKPEDVGVNVLVREIGEDRVKSIEVRGDILLINLHDEEAPQQKVKKEFEHGLYTQRELTESIFSSLKRKYGSKLRARNFKTQKVELLFKILAYNIERSIRIIHWLLKCHRHFYRAVPKLKIN